MPHQKVMLATKHLIRMIEVGNEWSAQFIAHIQEAEKL
jgi:hypothetical protein